MKRAISMRGGLIVSVLLSSVLLTPLWAGAQTAPQTTPQTAPQTTAAKPVNNLVDFNGIWHNDMGSAAILHVKNGLVSGTYQTNVGAPDKSKTFPLFGTVEGDQISFIVNFKGFGSMTAWVGQMVVGQDGKEAIRTLWHLTKDINDADEAKEIWGSIRTGASLFTR